MTLAILDADGPEGGLAGLWLELVGQLHPALVHFPVALLVVAALVELPSAAGGLFGREASARPARTAFVCLTFAVLGGAAAAFSGWTLAERMAISPKYEDLVDTHRWTGVAAAGLAIVAWVPALLARGGERRGALRLYRALLVVGAGVVSYAGHLGGSLVHGEDALTEPLEALIAAYRDPETIPPTAGEPDEQPPEGRSTEASSSDASAAGTEGASDAPPHEETPREGTPSAEPPEDAGPSSDDATAPENSDTADAITPPPTATEDLARAGRDLFAARCVECHNGMRDEGGLRLDTRMEIEFGDYYATAGDPEQSLIFERITLPADDEYRMPNEGDPLNASEVALVRAWIEAELPWPADGEPAVEPDR